MCSKILHDEEVGSLEHPKLSRQFEEEAQGASPKKPPQFDAGNNIGAGTAPPAPKAKIE